MAKQELTCDDILKELRAKQYRPIYYLMGEESYYIDLIADYITDNVLSETEKEFNLTVVYGADVDVATIINAAKRYPMMSEHQVVVVKEAQAVRNMEELCILYFFRFKQYTNFVHLGSQLLSTIQRSMLMAYH